MHEDPQPRPPQLDVPVAPLAGPASTARRRLLVHALVVGVGLAIIGLGVLGPKPEGAPSAPPGSRAPATLAASTPTAPGSSVPSPGPVGSPPETPVPVLRIPAGPLADPWVLHGGRWVDLSLGTDPGVETGCELEPSFVLAGGRIVCVAQAVTRSPGSHRATYDLSVITLGYQRTNPDDRGPTGPPAASLPGVAPRRVPLTTLVGRRDLVIGDPVAIALTPTPERDTLLLAWAVLDDTGYRIGLDRYVVLDRRVVRTGSRPIATLPASGPDAIGSVADLAVSVAPRGRTALVGFTASGVGDPVRRLAVAAMEQGLSAASIDAAAFLPASVATNAFVPPAADVPVTERAPAVGDACGGASGEGWATDGSIFLVCPGPPTTLRRIALSSSPAGGPGPAVGTSKPGAPSLRAAILDDVLVRRERPTGAVSLAGDGIVIDRLHDRYDRWSPATRTFWSIDLGAAPGTQAAADFVVLGGAGRLASDAGDPFGEGPPVRPILALDAAGDRLYALVPGAGGTGAMVEVLDATTRAPIASWPTVPEPFASLALSPDGRLLYLATPPRPVVGVAQPRVAVEVLDASSGRERLFAGQLSPIAWDPAQPLVVR